MALFIDGKSVNASLEDLIAEGEAIITQENIAPSNLCGPEIYAASIAVQRHDQAHAEWAEANDDEHMAKIRAEARKNVAKLRARISDLEEDKRLRATNGAH
jgi:hypothetical protein